MNLTKNILMIIWFFTNIEGTFGHLQHVKNLKVFQYLSLSICKIEEVFNFFREKKDKSTER